MLISKIQPRTENSKLLKNDSPSQILIQTTTKPYGADSFQKSNKTEPNFKGIVNTETLYHLQIGRGARNEGALKDAVKSFTKAIEIMPREATAYIERGLTFKKMNEFDKALKDYNRAIELEPSNAIVYYNRAMVFLELKKPDKARLDAFKAAELDPSDRDFVNFKNRFAR